MDEKFIFSLIGCITGVSGLVISLTTLIRTLIQERKNIKIEFHPLHCGYFKKIDCFSDYMTDYHAILHVQITNKSTSPNTINFFDTYIGNQLIQFRTVDIDKIKIPMSNLNRNTVIPMNPSFYLPIRLEPYDVKEFIVFYPILPKFDTETISGRITIGSAKGQLKTTFTMMNLNNLTREQQSNSQHLLPVEHNR